MTPYLIGGQWIMLETVLTASAEIWSDYHCSHGATLTIAFRDKPMEPILATAANASPEARKAARAKAQAIWDQFLAAWKANVAARQAPPLPAPTSSQPRPSVTSPVPE